MKLTLQTYNDYQWHDAYIMELKKPNLGRNSPITFKVIQGYAINYFGEAHSRSFSAQYPVNTMDIISYERWPGFMDDLLPTGYARDKWLELMGLVGHPSIEQDLALLTQATISPVGNIRVKEAVNKLADEHAKELDIVRFSELDLINRDHDFLAYARARGAVSGGATGAGGVAPKVLIRHNQAEGTIWIDAFQDEQSTDAHYLVKFPRDKQPIHADILRAEAAYYQILNDELGLNTIDTRNMYLKEGNQPSLWLPRFDRELTPNGLKRYGVESIYALLNKPIGSGLSHFEVIEKLREVVTNMSSEELVIEYLKRDLINVLFGNTDNHGRNIALLKDEQNTMLAPIFDFAPMRADPEQIIRTTTWGNKFELGGNIHWIELCKALEPIADTHNLTEQLMNFAELLANTENRLHLYEIPESIINYPTIPLKNMTVRLKQWGLLK